MVSVIASIALMLLAFPAQGAEREYPSRHIRMIAPFSGGSTLDITARLVADQLGARLGHKFEWTGWYGLWFPARTPQARVNRIQAEIRNAVAAPEPKSRLDELGLVPVASTSAEFARFLKEDLALQARIVKAAGLQPQ